MECNGTYATSTGVIDWVCTQPAQTICGLSTSTPCHVKGIDSLVFAFAVIISILSIMLIGFMFNHLNEKKPWR